MTTRRDAPRIASVRGISALIEVAIDWDQNHLQLFYAPHECCRNEYGCSGKEKACSRQDDPTEQKVDPQSVELIPPVSAFKCKVELGKLVGGIPVTHAPAPGGVRIGQRADHTCDGNKTPGGQLHEQ